MVYFLAANSGYYFPVRWLKNAIGSKCFEKDGNVKYDRPAQASLMGMSSTIMNSRFIFIPMSACFGLTYALHYVPTYDWVRTNWWRKLIRTFLATAFCIGSHFFSNFTLYYRDIVPLILFNRLIYAFILPFVVFGLLPIFFKWIGLVKRE